MMAKKVTKREKKAAWLKSANREHRSVQRRIVLLDKQGIHVKLNTYYYGDVATAEKRLVPYFIPTDDMSELEKVHLAYMHRRAVRRYDRRTLRQLGLSSKFYPPGKQGVRERSQYSRAVLFWEQYRCAFKLDTGHRPDWKEFAEYCELNSINYKADDLVAERYYPGAFHV